MIDASSGWSATIDSNTFAGIASNAAFVGARMVTGSSDASRSVSPADSIADARMLSWSLLANTSPTVAGSGTLPAPDSHVAAGRLGRRADAGRNAWRASRRRGRR